MKIKNVSWGLIPLIVTFLAITNPSEEEHIKHRAWQFKSDCQQNELTVPGKATCFVLSPLPHKTVEPLISNYSHHRNFIFFSTYTTDLWGLKTQTLGLGGQFFNL
ncbi:DUF4359 domain-containing protein [Limnospira platensis]|uniref:DUF4359 domain-containing protein n=1 Tax=Limnospira platensis TaxID=118562 RepID=UPI003D6FEF99